MSRFANADCECGYSLDGTNSTTSEVFTDLMENDFLHTSGDNITTFGWQPQEYNVSAKDARGPYGKEFDVANAELNPLKNGQAWSGDSVNGGDAGLKLWVRGDHSHGFISGAELATFYNNSQEIDMEFLSRQFNESQGTVQLVLQSPQSVRNGYDASGTAGYQVQHLPFRPDEKFHEYRFDWTPGSVIFYVDGQIMHEMTQNIPSDPGHMFMNHWSNGDPLWSAGPPGQDTSMTVSYVKTYFNSTDLSRNDKHKKQCPTFDPSKVCSIPAQTVAPDGNDAQTYFFSQEDGKTPGQTIYHTTNGNGAGRLFSVHITYISILVGFLIWELL
ncbi:uncharacterized protein N0V89_007497 [Didymosphaeria variabile]|uniref:GH16 domain-containing protein n=1 Tax=Didymosphaeria variabile TaxID=1932322 RepID=A0A9W9CA88_9PLEO|nr:uncharacterized protein N0V89_007497 [Didymosphaeria variabile]KAJ4352150.1 hypothetical protein N0V89_007497 [Didymosphaeria variabile]